MSSKPAPLFLYLKSSKLGAAELKKLRESGYVPIAVESFDDIKLIEPLSLAVTNVLTREAFASIAAYPHAGIHEAFGRRIAKAVADKALL